MCFHNGIIMTVVGLTICFHMVIHDGYINTPLPATGGDGYIAMLKSIRFHREVIMAVSKTICFHMEIIVAMSKSIRGQPQAATDI